MRARKNEERLCSDENKCDENISDIFSYVVRKKKGCFVMGNTLVFLSGRVDSCPHPYFWSPNPYTTTRI